MPRMARLRSGLLPQGQHGCHTSMVAVAAQPSSSEDPATASKPGQGSLRLHHRSSWQQQYIDKVLCSMWWVWLLRSPGLEYVLVLVLVCSAAAWLAVVCHSLLLAAMQHQHSWSFAPVQAQWDMLDCTSAELL